MGRKSRVPGSGASKDPRKWGRAAAKFLGGLAEHFEECADDITACDLLVAAVLREKTPRRTQAQVNQGFEAACEWAAQTIFQAIEETMGKEGARRIFAALGRPRKDKWERQRLALQLIHDRHVPLKQLAKDIAENPCLREAYGMPAVGDATVLAARLRVLQRRWKKEQAQQPSRGDAVLESAITDVLLNVVKRPSPPPTDQN
jgi:hypothetical protein